MATQRKGELAARVAAKLGGSKPQGEAALNAVLSSIREALASGDRVVLAGFGSFESRRVRERRVRGVRGRQLMSVPAHNRAAFSAGSQLTAAVRGHR